jgi:hypothetical protein
MAKKNQHIVPLGNGWAVKGEGNSKYTAITETKKDALGIGKQIAKNNKSELVIHGKDGRIQNKNSFGNDKNPPKDKVH